MSFCTAHRPHHQPPQNTAMAPLTRTERRVRRDKPLRTPGQIFTDWASI